MIELSGKGSVAREEKERKISKVWVWLPQCN